MRLAFCVPFLAAAAMSAVEIAPPATLPPDSAYCVATPDGHLAINGERVRFWGAIGSFPGRRETVQNNPYFLQREAIRRAKVVGFNLYRIWHLEFNDTAVKGDLSATDVSDFFIAECQRQQVRLWAAGFGGGALYHDDIATSAAIINEPGSVSDWSAAVDSMCKPEWWSNGRKAMSLLTVAVAWDPRLEALAIAQMRQKALHVNLYTGLRHADDPTIAIWELTNEQWWVSNMFNGRWQELPVFFRTSLIAKWNAFLVKKYGDQTGLAKAWGFLFPGEDLSGGSVLLAPLAEAKTAIQLNDSNPQAAAVFKTIAAPIGRDQCTTQRGSDVIEFLLDVIVSHKQRWNAQLKTWGKSTRLSPVVFDTGIGQSIQAQYLQMQGDAVAHCSYMEGIETDMIKRTSKRWPFYSGLDSAPQMCKDVPWLEHNRPVGKPFLCYETQFGGPSKYRAEWPMRIAALGAIQDWDAACYHYWTFDKYDAASKRPYDGPLSQPGPGAYQYDFTNDEVEQASMRAAGALFRHRTTAPAATPTIFRWGKPALLDPRSMDYGGDYGRVGLMDMMATAYTSGMRNIIDPEQKEFLKTEGPVTRFNGFERPTPIKPTSEITFDHQRACLTFDAPGAASYTGFLGEYGSDQVTFATSGVMLSKIAHHDPDGIAYPSGAERFTSFTLASEDGKPLASTSKVVLTLVASSFNTGLKLADKTDWGRTPVLVTRLGATVTAKPLAGMRWRMIDFHEAELASGTVPADGTLTIPGDKPVWLTELTRP